MNPTTLTVALARQRHPAVGRNRIYNAINSGALHAIRAGRRWAVHVDDLDSWVMSGCPEEQGTATSSPDAAGA